MFKVIGNTSRANVTQMESFPAMGRVRLPTGGFETLDGSRFKNQRTSSQTAEHGTRSINKRMHEIARAENRLRVIERISKYREDKIRLEFMKLESELKEEEDRQNEMVRREVRQKQYYIKQKERVAEYQKMKAAKRDQELKRQADEQKSAERRRQEKVNLNEELVSNYSLMPCRKPKSNFTRSTRPSSCKSCRSESRWPGLSGEPGLISSTLRKSGKSWEPQEPSRASASRP